MGAKRKAPSMGSAGKATPDKKAAKKAKVIDPTEEPLDTIMDALKGAVGKELGSDVSDMAMSIAQKALAAPVEDRSVMHSKFASLVGEALASATAELGKKSAAAAAALQDADSEQTSATAAVTTAKDTLTNCEAATLAAKDASTKAEDAKDETEDNLEKQSKELGNLDKAKEKQEKLSAELAAATEFVTSAESTSKDSKKVTTVLKSIGASDSMLASIPMALGKWGQEGFEAVILKEAAKVLATKSAEVNTSLGNWDGHVANMQSRATALTQQLETGKATLEARSAAVTNATAAQKAASAGVKQAEAALKAAQRNVDTKSNGKNKADQLVEDADEAAKAFQFLHTRSVAVEEAPAGSPSPAKSASPTKSPAKSPAPGTPA
jgi:hypothetical protein